jgi:hypothetical protein
VARRALRSAVTGDRFHVDIMQVRFIVDPNDGGIFGVKGVQIGIGFPFLKQ